MSPAEDFREKDGDTGFTLVEMCIALALFTLMSVAFASQLVNNFRVYDKAKDRTAAEQITSGVMERSRQLKYADIGIVGGTPPGLITAAATRTLNGVTYNIVNSVQLIDDPIPGGINPTANYKRLRVVVSSGGVTLSDLSTIISSPQSATAATAVMRILVADVAANSSLAGVTVSVAGGPSPLRTGNTGANGRVAYPGLLPTTAAKPYYDITVSKPGYQVYPDDVPPSPAVHTSFAPNQVFDTTIRMFKTVQARIRLINTDGSKFTQDTWIWFHCDRGGEWVLVQNGDLTISTLKYTSGKTEPLIPNLVYRAWWAGSSFSGRTFYGNDVEAIVPPNYPSSLKTTFTITMTEFIEPPTTTTATTVPDTGPAVTGPTTTAPPPTVAPTTSTSSTTTTEPDSGM